MAAPSDGLAGLALLVAAASAAAFAVSNAVQHYEAGKLQQAPTRFGLLCRLARRPRWLAGSMIGLLAFVLHAAALTLGPIAEVQPMMIVGVVLAVPFRATLERDKPVAAEVLAVALTCAGVCGLVLLSRAESNYGRAQASGAVLFGAVCYAAALALLRTSRLRRTTTGPGSRLAAAAGLLFGFSACLMKLLGESFHDGGLASVGTSWALWALIATGIAGMAINQRAYQQARISQTMPVLNAVDVSIAILAGWVVFGGAPAFGPLQLVGYPMAIGAVVTGLRLTTLALEEPAKEPPSATRQGIPAG